MGGGDIVMERVISLDFGFSDVGKMSIFERKGDKIKT